MFLDGKMTERNVEAAGHWFARGAELGVGRHVDPRRAAELYSLASQRGWPGGALGRARLAAVVPLSAPEAAALVAPLEAGCSAGNAESCWSLVGVLRARDGARTDAQRVRELAQRACDGGVKPACESLRQEPAPRTANGAR